MAPKSNQTARRAKAKAEPASRNRAGAASGATTPSAHNDDSMWQYLRAKPIPTPENMYVAMTLFEALSEDDRDIMRKWAKHFAKHDIPQGQSFALVMANMEKLLPSLPPPDLDVVFNQSSDSGATSSGNNSTPHAIDLNAIFNRASDSSATSSTNNSATHATSPAFSGAGHRLA